MRKKLTRTQNWTLQEKIGLFNHLKNRIHIIENRDPAPDVLDLKSRTWEEIHRELKQKRICFRGIIRLKEAWSRMKNHSKLELNTFGQMVDEFGIEEAFKWRPSPLSIEVKRLLLTIKPPQPDSVKIKKEIDSTSYLIQILDTHSSAIPLDVNSCQSNEIDPLSHIKVEDFSPGNSFIEPTTTIYLTENTKSFNNDESIDNANKRRRLNELEEFQEDNNEEIVSFAEIEYTKDDNKMQQPWSYDALNEEHKIRLQLLGIELEKAELQKKTALNELKTSDIKLRFAEAQANNYYSKVRMSGERGSGAGQGGGGGGAIRSAGGSFGKMEVANEDQYFYNQQKEQLKKMREELTDEISFHEEQIKRHEEAINRHKKRIGDMEK
ncbi:hypothetical protein PV328_005074 [Microctonus aethiopoides]|uniref:Regulatory protein zeste n=1 Tax=Microctonus aethiopoides TaxID=144406 RepID=A0AA39FLC3_9HYME|nr:hypothetical protein PV328_005074 [Microctonus aethiopoides]